MKTQAKNQSGLSVFGINANLITVFGMILFFELGQRISERFLPIYLLAVGGGTFVVGLSGALNNFLGAIYSLPGGYLSDRVGYKRSLIIFNIVALVGYLIAAAFPSWTAALVGGVLFATWSGISLPAIMSAVSKNLPSHKHTFGVSVHSLIRRFPMALGPIVGGFFIAQWGERDGVRWAFLFAALVAFVSIFVQRRLIREVHEVNRDEQVYHPLKLLAQMKPDLRRLLISDILIRFCEQIPYGFVVIWCLKNVGVTPVQFGLLTTIEMVTAILVYIPVALLVERYRTKKVFIAITFGFFSLFPVMLLFSKSLVVLSVAFWVRGLKEFGEPTRKSLILDFAKGPNQGALFGVYYLLRDVVVAGAALAGGGLWAISPAANLLTATVFGVLGTLYFILFCKE
ncbi:MAG: MFS transporter [Bdellovibrionales bacterium]|nr:MFS transporter [Bdellovibrionales bacterium]